MKFATVITLVSAIAKANGKSQHTLRRRGLVEEEMSIAMLDTNKHNSNSESGETEGSSDEPDVDVCNLVEFAGLWNAIDDFDGRNLKASIKCFKNECGCRITYVDDDEDGCGKRVATQDYFFDPESNALSVDVATRYNDNGNSCLESELGPNKFIVSDDGSLEFRESDPLEDGEIGDGPFTFWRVSQSVDTLPRRPPPPPPPPAVIANNDFVSVPEGFVGSKDFNVLENDDTDTEGIELKVVAIVAQPEEGNGFCTIPHDNDKVVEYYYPPDSPSFGGASCTYRVCTVPSADVPQIVCDMARVDILAN